MISTSPLYGLILTFVSLLSVQHDMLNSLKRIYDDDYVAIRVGSYNTSSQIDVEWNYALHMNIYNK